MTGFFITFEGLDGSGKTTQMNLLARRLRRAGIPVTIAREPGGTRAGKGIRRILLSSKTVNLDARAEALLYFASRAQNVSEVILPALKAGHVVLCDRFTDSSMAYQGYGRNLGREAIEALDRMACQGLKPDHTILIEIEPGRGVRRAQRRNVSASRDESRLEKEGAQFFQRVQKGYRDLARREPERVQLIRGNRGVQEIHAEIWDLVVGWASARRRTSVRQGRV